MHPDPCELLAGPGDSQESALVGAFPLSPQSGPFQDGRVGPSQPRESSGAGGLRLQQNMVSQLLFNMGTFIVSCVVS